MIALLTPNVEAEKPAPRELREQDCTSFSSRLLGLERATLMDVLRRSFRFRTRFADAGSTWAGDWTELPSQLPGNLRMSER